MSESFPAKVVGFVRFAKRAFAEFLARARQHGMQSALTYAKWWLRDLYIRQRAKFMSAPRVECPICGWKGFDFFTLDCGTFTVPHVNCPQCNGHERHRMMHLYLNRVDTEFFTRRGLVLHFAPEVHIEKLISHNTGYKRLCTDYAWYMAIRTPGIAFQSDMQQMPVKNDAFDVIFCLHVLEHVPSDIRGIAELHRILKPGGVAYIMVPFMMGWPKTVEFGKPDPMIFDHFRGYSPDDFGPRVSAFDFEEIKPGGFLSAEELLRYRIPADSQVIYRCSKR